MNYKERKIKIERSRLSRSMFLFLNIWLVASRGSCEKRGLNRGNTGDTAGMYTASLEKKKKKKKCVEVCGEEKVIYSASLQCQRKKAHVNIFIYSVDLVLLDANNRKTDRMKGTKCQQTHLKN